MSLTIVADENIAGLEQLNRPGWTLLTLPGRAITPQHLRQADALLVRSVTAVNASLLAGSPVTFVATATSGLDHIDLDYLQRHDIGFAAAAGANADSVVDYVFAALAVMALDHGIDWLNARIAVLGAGQVGGRLLQRLDRLGVDTRICDPFLSQSLLVERQLSLSQTHFIDLEEALSCDILSLHTPLSKQGDYPTHHLLDAKRVASLKEGQVLINAARGAVVDNRALLARLREAHAPFVVLDTWEGEPDIDPTLLQEVTLATPHIAGYGTDGKWRATRMILAALQSHFQLEGSRADDGENGPSSSPVDTPQCLPGESRLHWLSRCILLAYDLRLDDTRMRATQNLPAEARRTDFDRQRRHYPVRREFSGFTFVNVQSQWQLDALTAVGFSCTQPR